jgi:hypothetical protein
VAVEPAQAAELGPVRTRAAVAVTAAQAVASHPAVATLIRQDSEERRSPSSSFAAGG